MTAPKQTAAELADLLERCDREMTPGEWKADLDIFSEEEGIVACVVDGPISMLVKIETGLEIAPQQGPEWTAEDSARRDAQWAKAREGQELRDATGIAALRNAAPSVAQCLREMAAENRDLCQIKEAAQADAKMFREQRDAAEKGRDEERRLVTHYRETYERVANQRDAAIRDRDLYFDGRDAEAIRANKAETERDAHHQMLRDILALCDDSTRTSLGPDAPLRAVRKVVTALEVASAACDSRGEKIQTLTTELAAARGQIINTRAAARRFVAAVDDLAAFADDNDPRVMATAGPIGAAHADLWAALGLDLDAEHARLQADIDSRCAVCGWPLAEFLLPTSTDKGCERGKCSQRPRPTVLYAPERAKRESASKEPNNGE